MIGPPRTIADRVAGFFIGWKGGLGLWIFVFTISGCALAANLMTEMGSDLNIFQRSGGLLTAILVPLFAFVLSKMSLWRAYIYAEKARIENKELHKISILARTNGEAAWESRIDDVLHLSSHQSDLAEVEPVVLIADSRAMLMNAILLFSVTIVATFGDLVVKLLNCGSIKC